MSNPHPVVRGRKNRPNKVSAERVRQALATGSLPAEQLLALGRTAISMAAKFQRRVDALMEDPKADRGQLRYYMAEFKEWFRLATEANAKGAPYYSYRLAAIKMEAGAPDVANLNSDELDILEKAARILGESGTLPDGAGPKVH